MQRDNVLKKLNFDLLTPHPRVGSGRGGGSACKIFATMLLHLLFNFLIIYNLTMF